MNAIYKAWPLEGKTALVLGGHGFIGSELACALAAKGCKAKVFGRRATHDFGGIDGIQSVVGDFTDGVALATALEGVDIVYHLVSSTVPSTSNLNPVSDVSTNLTGTVRLLEIMREKCVKRIVYVSSGGTVYGNPVSLPVTEDHPLEPLCSYGIVKVAVENYLRMYAHLYGFHATILRVSNPYGENQARIGVQGLILTLLKKVMANEPIEIWGDGSIVRDYIYISDVVAALIQAAERSATGVFNIGSGLGYSINEILELVAITTNQKLDISFLKKRNFDVSKIYLDIGKANTEFGWEPVVDLLSGCSLCWQALTVSVKHE